MFKFHEIFGQQEIGKIVHYLPDKKILPGSRYYADCAQNLSGPAPDNVLECSRFHPNCFTFGGVISERMNTVRPCSKVNPIFGQSLLRAE